MRRALTLRYSQQDPELKMNNATIAMIQTRGDLLGKLTKTPTDASPPWARIHIVAATNSAQSNAAANATNPTTPANALLR